MNKRTVENDCLIITDENQAALLSIKEVFQDGIMQVSVAGNITMQVAHDFEDEMMSVASVCSRIEIDLSGVDVIVSAGLKTLLSIQKMLDKKPDSVLKLKGLTPSVHQTFEDLGFLELFEIEK